MNTEEVYILKIEFKSDVWCGYKGLDKPGPVPVTIMYNHNNV